MKTSLSSVARALAPVLAILFAVAPGAQAAAIKPGEEIIATEKVSRAYNCTAFPDVAWWINDPAKVVNLVNKRYKGDWDTYIFKWLRYEASMQRSLENGEVRVIESQNKTLSGPTLSTFVALIRKRIAALQCIRDSEDSN